MSRLPFFRWMAASCRALGLALVPVRAEPRSVRDITPPETVVVSNLVSIGAELQSPVKR